jgi:hypothetical protein
LLRQSIFGNIQQEELPDAIRSLWKHRYLQRLDLEPYSIPPYSESARRFAKVSRQLSATPDASFFVGWKIRWNSGFRSPSEFFPVCNSTVRRGPVGRET